MIERPVVVFDIINSMKKIWLFVLSGVLLVAVVDIIVIFSNQSAGIYLKKNNRRTNATSTSSSITSQADWQAGTVSNVDSTSGAGSINIDSKGASNIDLIGKTIIADYDDSNKGRLVDGATSPYWGSNAYSPTDYYWQIDIGEAKNIKEIRVFAAASDWWYKIQYSNNGTDFSDYSSYYSPAGGGWATYTSVVSTRFIKVQCSRHTTGEMAPPGVYLGEITIQSDASATHTSASTQIDGSEGGTKNFIEWETFTPTYTEPANTNVKFRFRTSADASTWTSWSDYQTPASDGAFDISAIVDSASGANKYLQVETTLENTDGSSTPTVDSYSVGYHTNLAPSTPTNLTAVVGE